MFRLLSIICLLISIQTVAQSTKIKRITGVNDSYPVLSTDGRTLLFQSDRLGNADVWSMSIDGTNLKRLTTSAGYDGNPSLSPDGKTIAFTSTRDGDLEIYTMGIDGTNQKRLTNTKGNDGHPHWYPDGSRLIFNSARTSDAANKKNIDEIFSMKPDGTDVQQLTNIKSVSTYASVSPDGRRIVFRGSTDSPAYNWDMTSRAGNLNSEIFVMDIDGKNIVNVSNSASFDGWPTWSPGSDKIIYASNRSGKGNSGQLYTCDADGTNFQQLTDLPGAVAQPFWSADGKNIYGYQLWETPDEQYGYVVEIPVTIKDKKVIPGPARAATSVVDSYPNLSPDGKTVLFQSNRTGNTEIFTIDISGKDLKQLTTTTTAPNYGPVWSPNGELICFASERDKDSEIYVMKKDGSSQTRLTNFPGDDSHPHWFPDSKRVIFNSAQNTPDQTKDWGLQYHDVYSITIEGKDLQRYTDNKTVTTYPSVSPDGKKLSFRSVVGSPALNWDMTLNKRSRNSEAFIMNLETREQVNIAAHPAFDGWPAWLADSKSVVFASNRNGRAGGGQLFIVDMNGKTVRQLTDLPGGVAQPSCSADGKYVLAYQCWESADGEFGNIIMIEL